MNKKTARPTTIRRIVREIPADFAVCRSLQHAWRYTDVQQGRTLWTQVLRCTRCDTQKMVDIDPRSGEIVGTPRYAYVDHYLVPGLGRMTKAERGLVRLTAIESSR